MWCRRSASLSLLLLTLSASGCIDFDAERARYCAGGGSGCPVDPGSEGDPDAGPDDDTDAGPDDDSDAGPDPEPVLLRLSPLADSATQTRRVGALFPLEVAVTDLEGAAVAGVRVQFAAPAGAELPGGTFAGGAALSVETDAQGIARAQLTANGTAGSFAVQATAEGGEAAASFALTTVVPVPSSLQLTTPDSLEVVVGGTLPSVRARVLDQLGEVLAGATVSFDMPATLSSARWPINTRHVQSISDAEGLVASPEGVANQLVGAYEVALSAGTAYASVSVRNVADVAQYVELVGATPLKAPVMQAFPAALFEVQDQYGNPVPGHTVRLETWMTGSNTWARFGSGANLSESATATTGPDGRFTLPTLTANAYAGTCQLNVYLRPADITAKNNYLLEQVAGPASQLAVLSGDEQGTLVGTLFKPLAVSVKDAWGNPVRTGTVSFTAPPVLTNSPTAVFGAVNSNVTTATVDLASSANPGVAQVVPRANLTPAGTTYAVTAQYEGNASLKHLFELANDKYQVRLDPSEEVVLRDGASLLLSARLTDASGNGVASQSLAFTAPAGSGTFVTSNQPTVTLPTDAAGNALTEWKSQSCQSMSYAVEVMPMRPPVEGETGPQPVLAFPARFLLQNLNTSPDC